MLTVQENFGQVAWQIINHRGNDMLWHCSDEELKVELERCRRKLAQAQRHLWMNWPFVTLLLGVVALVGGLLHLGALGHPQAGLLGLAVFLLGVALPQRWLALLREREGMAISFYKERIAWIEFILRDRQEV
jgi:hypothetical protein